ncbi:MAG: MurR/RpiR family transcriptional regulator [Firmicutes bacterium]|nr:MurR/RpiR family transcriptional regulator [Bacillota bacterium]
MRDLSSVRKSERTFDKIPIQNCIARLRSAYPSLRPAEKRVADELLGNPEGAVNLSITEVAKRGNTSETTVIRLMKLLGYKGFHEFKIALAKETPYTEMNIYEQIRPADKLEDVAFMFFQTTIRALSDTFSLLQVDELKRAIEAINKARRVYCYGVGASGHVAIEAQDKFLRIDVPAWAFTDSHSQVSSAAMMTPEDVAIGISHSGRTRDTIEALALAKKASATTICLTSDHKSPITDVADICLVAVSGETLLKAGKTISWLSQLAMIDLLTLGVSTLRQEKVLRMLERMAEAVADKKVK